MLRMTLWSYTTLTDSAEAQAYMDRQREAGKSHKEAMRCLKRHLSNVVYRHLVADARRAELAA
jgi:transposase